MSFQLGLQIIPYFVIQGHMDKVIGFSDAMIFAMCFPNLIGLYFLMPEARRELAIYLTEIRKGRLAAPK